MKFSLRTLSLVSSAAVLVAAAVTASADPIQGTVYSNICCTSTSNPQGANYALSGVTIDQLSNVINGTPATMTSPALPGTSGVTTFTANTVNFYAPNASSTLSDFLNTVAGNVTVTSSTAPAGTLATGSLMVLTGTVNLENGASYTLLHDDGVNLYISPFGTPISNSSYDWIPQGAQTSANQSPDKFNGVSGAYNFELIYVSNYENPSELTTGTNPSLLLGASPTPEPSSFVLLGSGLLAAAGMLRRRMTA